MQNGLYIQRNKLLWVHNGVRSRLSMVEAARLQEQLTQHLSVLNSQLEQSRIQWLAIEELDTQLRALDVPWREQLALHNGSYHFNSQCSLPTLLELLDATVDPARELFLQLLKLGAFDEFLWSSEMLVQTGVLATRLRELSEPMEWLGPCRFSMGDDSLEAWDFEMPVHEVELSNGLWVGRYPVTQQLFYSVMDSIEGIERIDLQDRGALKPMVHITWLESLLFCNRLSQLTGREPVYTIHNEVLMADHVEGASITDIVWDSEANGYRLLTEAEWECAGKAFQPFAFSGHENVDEVAWFADNSSGRLSTVGQKLENALGIHDMSGLIWEWCWDGYDSEYYASSPSVDPKGADPTSTDLNSTNPNCTNYIERVCRGGSFLGASLNARVTLRGRAQPTVEWNNLGFRIACSE